MNFIPDFENSLLSVVFWIFSGFAAIQFFYVVFFQGKLAFYKKKSVEKQQLPSLSVIIAARNESDNLFTNLPSILEQNYPDFEVIVVNHQSIDESYHVLNAYKMKYPHLKIVEVERSKHIGVGKKLPLTLGIKSAKNEHLVFTDADCMPASKEWLKEIASCFSEKKEIVIGYGPYKEEDGLLNKLIRLDTTMIAMNYFSMALSRVPYMAVGRNLAYKKSTFNGVNGFKSHYAVSSGDDDLFIQQAAKKKNYTIQIDPKSFVFSTGKEDWTTWYQQKTRHYSTSSRYSKFKKAILGVYPLSLLVMLGLFCYLLTDNEFRWLSVSVFSFVLVVKWLIQGLCFSKLGSKKFITFLPILDAFYAIFIPILYYSTDKKKLNNWK
jgi:poly-beta-1,6-N-acetyl-D-glucosamine synthase